jgi:hypothetical protein
MKLFIFIAIFFISTCHASEKELVENFSSAVREIISSQNRLEFKLLPVYPDINLSNNLIEYVFKQEGLSGFFKNEGLLEKIYGPYNLKGSEHNNVYSIVFYDPDLINPNLKGFFNPDEIKKYWGKGYIETVVTVVKGVVLFNRTAFYYGAHAPWEDDY